MQQEIQIATINNSFGKFCCKREPRNKIKKVNRGFWVFFKMGDKVFIYANGRGPIEREIDAIDL